jgi:ABC-type dipeptide/oligopeptide/nickel transport system ATPase component
LITRIPTKRGPLTAVDDVSFSLEAGEIFGLVGESGSGKSMTCRSILQLVPPPGQIVGGRILYQGRDLLALSHGELRQIRG